MVAYYTEIFFPDNDVRLLAVNDNIDTYAGENEFMAFKSVINEYYARDCSKKIRSVKYAMALKGQYSGAAAPYGYIKSPNDKHKLIIDEDAATVVRSMFQMAYDGMGTQQIARVLAEAKIQIPAVYKYRTTGIRANRFDENYPYDWRASTVRRILESRAYVGAIVCQKHGSKSFKNQKLVRRPESDWVVVEGMHEPLVDLETFDRVNKLITLKRKPNSANRPNIFAGLLVCHDCGSNMNLRIRQGSGRFDGQYMCNRYRHSGSGEEIKTCTSHYLPYVVVYNAVLSRLGALFADNISEEDIRNQLSDGCDPFKAAKMSLEKLRRRDGELRAIIRKIVEQNALGVIDQVTFADLYNGYRAEQDALAARIKTVQSELSAPDVNQENVRRFVDVVQKYKSVKELTREMLLDVIEKIVVYQPVGDWRRGNRQYKLDFHYRFAGQ